MIIPGMVSATFRNRTVEEVIEFTKKAGLKAIEWSENAHVMPDDFSGAMELYNKTKNAGLEIAAYGSYYKLGEQENVQEVFQKTLISAIALKAPLIRIWGGVRPSEELTDDDRMKLASEARIVCEMADQAGIKVALEWHKNSVTDTNESALRFLEETGHKNLYCLWQPTVALNEEQRNQGISLLKDRLLNLHVYYWLEGKRRPFKEGLEYWESYIKNVPEGDRYALLEFVLDNTPEQFYEDAEYFVKLLDQIQKQQ